MRNYNSILHFELWETWQVTIVILCSTSNNCRVMDFSSDGLLFAWCDGTRYVCICYSLTTCMCNWYCKFSVSVKDCITSETLFELALPRTRCLAFSPRGSYLITWEPYIGKVYNAHTCVYINLMYACQKSLFYL